jgi:drug/metabolite transporter (DMT)-like permease
MGEAIWPQTLAAWGPLLLLGLGVHIAGQGGLAFGFGRVPAGPASIIILIQPLVSAIAGWVMFGEALVPLQWLGAALVLAGAWLTRRGSET